MSETCDVLVLGGGIAGVSAALAAADQGARVLVVRSGPGASAVSLGGWLGAPPSGVSNALARGGLPLELIAALLPRPDGALLRVDAAPPSHVRAALPGARGSTLVCGIAGLPGFHPVALAALWSDAAGLPAGSVAPATLTLAGTPAGGWSPISLAAMLERQPAHLAEPLAAVARQHGATRVFLPAVLGLEAHVAVHADVEAHAGVAIGEALGAAPSIPGWRLDVAVRAALAHAGVTVLVARVTDKTAHAQRVDTVSLTGDVGTRTIQAAAIVLATGRFIGGGVTADPAFAETALGCAIAPRWLDRTFTDASSSLMLTAERRTDPQPLLDVGVHTDAEARPLTATGDVAYHNVFVAGSVRAGAATATLGLGHAATDGWNAGQRAVAHARAR